jgi:hypothetical protein
MRRVDNQRPGNRSNPTQHERRRLNNASKPQTCAAAAAAARCGTDKLRYVDLRLSAVNSALARGAFSFISGQLQSISNGFSIKPTGAVGRLFLPFIRRVDRVEC